MELHSRSHHPLPRRGLVGDRVATRRHFHHFHAGGGRARVLRADILALDADLVAQGEHDGADHRCQQDQARDLEEVGVFRVEHAAERDGVGHVRVDRRRGGGDLLEGGIDGGTTEHQQQLGQQSKTDQKAERRMLEKPGAQFSEIDVEHHDDEQEEHGDGADIDDDQDHRQELRAHQQEQPGGVEERQDEEQHGVHGIAGADHHQRRADRHEREQIEEGGLQKHVSQSVGRVAAALAAEARQFDHRSLGSGAGSAELRCARRDPLSSASSPRTVKPKRRQHSNQSGEHVDHIDDAVLLDAPEQARTRSQPSSRRAPRSASPACRASPPGPTRTTPCVAPSSWETAPRPMDRPCLPRKPAHARWHDR